MIESFAQDKWLNIKWLATVSLDTAEDEKALEAAEKIFNKDWNDFKRNYSDEHQKYLENKKAAKNQFTQKDKKVDDAPKINLDTTQLDAAISKADELIVKLKTVKLLMDRLNKN